MARGNVVLKFCLGVQVDVVRLEPLHFSLKIPHMLEGGCTAL